MSCSLPVYFGIVGSKGAHFRYAYALPNHIAQAAHPVMAASPLGHGYLPVTSLKALSANIE